MADHIRAHPLTWPYTLDDFFLRNEYNSKSSPSRSFVLGPKIVDFYVKIGNNQLATL